MVLLVKGIGRRLTSFYRPAASASDIGRFCTAATSPATRKATICMNMYATV
jgi:hypothetical protein